MRRFVAAITSAAYARTVGATDADYAALHIAVAIIGALVLIALVAWRVQRWRWRRLERAFAPALPPAAPAPSVPLPPRDPDYWRPRKLLPRILRLLTWPITGEVTHRRPPDRPVVYIRRDEGGGGGGM